MRKDRPSTCGIIPARFQSSRFPGKLLEPILGKSVIQRTYESALKCTLLDEIIIACDDVRIFDHALQFGAKAVMTSPECLTGTDRIIEALKKYPDAISQEIIVNIQGDEPCIAKNTLDAVVTTLITSSEEVMATACVKITDTADILNPSVVKCVMTNELHALYFSRSPIPGMKPGGALFTPYYKHLGIYAFRRDFLKGYADLPMTPLQRTEDLEQLKVLEAGYKIKVAIVEENAPHVDVPEDIEKVLQWLCSQNISL